MKCVKCGKDIIENSKFCEYCGTPIEETPNVVEPAVRPVEPTVNVAESNVPPVSQPAPVEPKKKSNALVFIIIAIALVAIGAVLFFILNGNKTTKGDISTLEKAMENTVKTASKSGTVIAKIEMKSDDTSMNLSGSVKYQILDDEVKAEVKVDKSSLFDEMLVYGTINKDNFNLYAKSNLVDMLLGTVSDEVVWVSLSSSMEDSGLDLDGFDLDSIENSDSDFSLDEFGSNLRYVGKKDGLSHYVLTIDKDLINRVKEASDEQKELLEQMDADSILDKPYNVDFYVNGKNELEKVSIDMADYVKEYGIEKLVVTIEFKDLGKTVVDIPSSVTSSSVDYETYIEEHYDYDYDYDYDDEDLDF